MEGFFKRFLSDITPHLTMKKSFHPKHTSHNLRPETHIETLNTWNKFSPLHPQKKTRTHIITNFHILLPNLDKPGPPESPEVTEVDKENATLTWQPPTTDGGSPVTGYVIERRMTSSARWVICNKEPVPELTYKVTDLMEDSEYEFRISAVNKVGQGEPSSPTKPVTAKDAFSEYHFHSTDLFFMQV